MGGACLNNGGWKNADDITKWTVPDKRKRGRRKSKWIDWTEDDLRHLGVKNWERVATNKDKWRKNLRGCQGSQRFFRESKVFAECKGRNCLVL